jgi:hypothetical protein
MLYQNFSHLFRKTSTKRFVVLPSILAATVLLYACGSGQSDDIVCTTEARASVMMTVVDANNTNLPDVSVSYSIDSASPKTQICDTNGACVLEYEVPGEFSITASKAGYLPASATVKVSRSACHVNTERVSLTLNTAN